MTEFPFEVSEIKLALKRQELNYKLLNYIPEDCDQETLIFSDPAKGRKLKGKVVRVFNEGEVYHWPQLNHENIVPLLEVLSVRDDLNVFLTTDLQTQLKNIIHEEDFVYDSKCFDRKRAYARGIFSGLSYLHGKSLCLMNLSDENIYICRIYDRAIITNFSTLVCSQRSTKSKMKVCELYRAPETEKGEFDAMAAELWASGTLMLDVFLAHMVPWAIINYKPRRILVIVDKLSMELIQAANAGSVVTTVDLTKFKAFLKCFFRDNPCMRIPARYALIASFLKPKFENNTVKIHPTRRIPCLDNKNKVRKHFSSCSHSEPSTSLPRQTNKKQNSLMAKHLSKQCSTLTFFDSERKNCNLFVDSEIPRWLVPYATVDTTNCWKIDDKCFYLSNSRNPADTLFSYKGDRIESIEAKISIQKKTLEKPSQIAIDTIHICGEKDDRTPGMFLKQKETSKSCQLMENGTNILAKSGYALSQSKSSSFIKSTANDAKSEVSFRVGHSRNCSYPSIKPLSLKHSSSNNWQKSDFCLNRLFGENESSGDVIEEERVTHEVWFGSNTPDKKHFQNLKCISLQDDCKQDIGETRQLQNETDRDSVNQLDIQHITENILFLRSCQVSLQEHLRIFSNDEFVQKQQNLINEYQLLLSQEKNRLYEILKNKYALNIDEIIKAVNSISRYNRTCSKTQCTHSTPDSSHERPAFKFVKYTGHNDAKIRAVKWTERKFRDQSAVHPNWQSESTKFSQKNIQKSEERNERDRIPFETEEKSEDKLTNTETKWKRCNAGLEEVVETEADRDQQQVSSNIADTGKNSTKLEKNEKGMKESSSDHGPRNNGWRRIFFSLCPWRKVKDSNPFTDDLCETCKPQGYVND